MAELFFSVPFRRGGLYIIGVPASLSECRYSLHFSLFFFLFPTAWLCRVVALLCM